MVVLSVIWEEWKFSYAPLSARSRGKTTRFCGSLLKFRDGRIGYGLAERHSLQHIVALKEVMDQRRGDMDHDERDQHIGRVDVQVFVEVRTGFVCGRELRHAKQPEPVGIIGLV